MCRTASRFLAFANLALSLADQSPWRRRAYFSGLSKTCVQKEVSQGNTLRAESQGNTLRAEALEASGHYSPGSARVLVSPLICEELGCSRLRSQRWQKRPKLLLPAQRDLLVSFRGLCLMVYFLSL